MPRTALTEIRAAAWPREAGWLVPGKDGNCSWLEYLVVRRSACDEGIVEQPWASNRGTRIDAMTRRAGLSPPVYWCGIEVGVCWADCGALVPRDFPAVDAFLPHLESEPGPGWAVVYGPSRQDGTHIGLVTRTRVGRPEWPSARDNLTREGNRGAGASATNNGIGVLHALQTRTDVLGYVRPQPVPGWSIARFAPAWLLLEHWAALPPAERAAAAAKIEQALRGSVA